ncbi:MAG: peptidoglycan DD-metalloendopeptidase family protein, partial [Patescibacteria group bacterium]
MFKKTIIIFLLVIFGFGQVAFSATSFELDQALQEKAKKLQEINQKLQATHENLVETEGQSRSLRQELTKIGKDIKQLNLGIESSQITIEKLNLEIESLQYDIKDIEKNIRQKKEALSRLIRRLQANDQETFMINFLKNKTLSANFAQASGYSAINNQISQGIGELKLLQEQLNEKLNQTSNKKFSVESEHKNLKVKKNIVIDREAERKNLLAQTKNQEKLYQQQISELEKKQLAIAEEIEQLEATLRAQSDPNSLPGARSGILSYPIQGLARRISQAWGATRFAKNGYRGGWHNGLDFAGPFGTAILAAEGGIVLVSGDQDQYCRRGAYGKYIVIRHSNGLVTLYGHLSRYLMSAGDLVKRSDVIGYMGSTGYSTGSHLHFTVYDGKTFAMRPSRSCG